MQEIQQNQYTQILHDLREEEALRVVDESAIGVAHVIDPRVRAVYGEVLLDAVRGRCRALEVLRVARDAPRVEVRLEHLRPQDVVRAAVEDVEAMLRVEREVGRRRRGPIRHVPVWPRGDPCEGLGADACAAGDVRSQRDTSGW